MNRSSTLRRRTPLRARSRRRDAFDRELRAARPEVEARSGGRCEARCNESCTGVAVHVHHKAGRVGSGVNHPDLLLHCCQRCHLYVHRYPSTSYEFGWMVRRVG